MNNPLLFTDPSGYRPDLIFEEEQRISAGQDFGGGGGGSWNPFGWMNQWGGSSGISWRADPYGGWTYNWTRRIYENRATGETMTQMEFSYSILPRYSIELSAAQTDKIIDGLNSLNSSAEGTSGKHSWNTPMVQALGFDNHFFQYNRTTGEFYAPWTGIVVNPLAILTQSIAGNAGNHNLLAGLFLGITITNKAGSFLNKLNKKELLKLQDILKNNNNINSIKINNTVLKVVRRGEIIKRIGVLGNSANLLFVTKDLIDSQGAVTYENYYDLASGLITFVPGGGWVVSTYISIHKKASEEIDYYYSGDILMFY